MSEIEEQQREEIEALVSIYEGDTAFKQINPTTFQYKYGDDNEPKSFLLEVSWGETYPNDAPKFNLDTFYNSHIVTNVKQKIISVLEEEAQNWLGCGMTYTLFECLKEKIEELLADQPESKAALIEDSERNESEGANKPNEGQAKVKKEQLTKAQKRRQWERTDHEGNRARGWNWVDICQHLSQIGKKDECGIPPS